MDCLSVCLSAFCATLTLVISEDYCKCSSPKEDLRSSSLLNLGLKIKPLLGAMQVFIHCVSQACFMSYMIFIIYIKMYEIEKYIYT